MTSSVRPIGLAVLLAAALTVRVAAAQQPAPQAAPAAPAARGAAPAAPAAPVKITYAMIPAGEFLMGCSKGDTMCDEKDQHNEKPQHSVKITKPFELGTYVVTQGQWTTVMGSAPPSTFKGDNLPVENVSWNQIQDFLTKINSLNDGFKYRLPTEAEWEYAARAGTTEAVPGGSLDAIAWYDQKGGPRTRPVGTKAANAWGLYDMLGNVMQWVQDSYSDYKKNAVSDPLNTKGDTKVIKGGGWDAAAGVMRVSARWGIAPNLKNNNAGFRLVREAK